MKSNEHQIQKDFFTWIEWYKNKLPELKLFHAVPNGGERNAIVAARLKAEGVRAGVLDTQMPVARGGFNGLAIEFKAPWENPTKEQKERAESLMNEGWCVAFCWSWQTAARFTLGYLGLARVEVQCLKREA